MLVFKEWPPRAGSIEFSKGSLEMLKQRESMPTPGYSHTRVFELAHQCGSIIRVNSTEQTTQEIGKELVSMAEKFDRCGKPFSDGYFYGAGFEERAFGRSENQRNEEVLGEQNV